MYATQRIRLLCCLWFCLTNTGSLWAKADARSFVWELSFAQGHNGLFKKGESLTFYVKISNTSQQAQQEKLYIKLWNKEKKTIYWVEKSVVLKPGQQVVLPIRCAVKQAGYYTVLATYARQHKALSTLYATETLQPTMEIPADFDDFWQQTRAQLKNIPPQFQLKLQPQWSTPLYEVFLLEMKSWGGLTIRAWYRLPRKRQGKVPVMVQLQGLGTPLMPAKLLDTDPMRGVPANWAVLSLNIRGHGNSNDKVKLPWDRFFVWQILSREHYIYRAVLMDAVRAIDFVSSRPEIDPNAIAVEGWSQGGGLALMLTALDKRVKACWADAPFLTYWRNHFALNAIHQTQLKQYLLLQNTPNAQLKVYRTLRYYDALHFVPRIQVPVLMSIGLQDRTCFPLAALLAFKKIPYTAKKIVIYPYAEHQAGASLQTRREKFQWLKAQWPHKATIF